MKIVILSITIAILSSVAYSQVDSLLPLKSGFVYYKFEHKLDNSEKCLSEHAPSIKKTSLRDFERLNQDLNSEKKKLLKKLIEEGEYAIIAGIHGSSRPECKEILTEQITIRFPMMKPLTKFGKYKKVKVTAEAELEFISKTEYTYIVKGFQLTTEDISYSITGKRGDK